MTNKYVLSMILAIGILSCTTVFADSFYDSFKKKIAPVSERVTKVNDHPAAQISLGALKLGLGLVNGVATCLMLWGAAKENKQGKDYKLFVVIGCGTGAGAISLCSGAFQNFKAAHEQIKKGKS